MITDEELINEAVPAINRRFNIWRLNEAEEAEYIRGGLEAIVAYIPQRVRPILRDGADGLDDAEVAKHASQTLDNATAAAVSVMPQWVRVMMEPMVRAQLAPIVREVFEYAQVGFAFGLPKGGA